MSQSPVTPWWPRRRAWKVDEPLTAAPDGRIRARLEELGLRLHGPHLPHDPLDAVVVHGGVARTSGQLPRIDGVLTCVGTLGETVTVEEGAEAAAVCALNALGGPGEGARLARPGGSAALGHRLRGVRSGLPPPTRRGGRGECRPGGHIRCGRSPHPIGDRSRRAPPRGAVEIEVTASLRD